MAVARELLDDQLPEVRGPALRVLADEVDEQEVYAQKIDLLRQVLERFQRDTSPVVRLHALQGLPGWGLRGYESLLAEKDPFIRCTAINGFVESGSTKFFNSIRKSNVVAERLGALLVLERETQQGRDGRPGKRAHWVLEELYLTSVPDFLADPDPEVRRAAIQWVAEERLEGFARLLPAAASREPVTKELFEAWLAANDFLSGTKRQPTDEPAGEDFIAKILKDDKQPVVFRTLAMRMLRPDHPAVDANRLSGFLASKEAGLRREAVRTLVLRTDAKSQELLRRLATEENTDKVQRAAAVAGLAHSAASSRPTQRLLLSMLDKPELRREALRSLRPVAPGSEAERVILNWWEKLKADGEEKRELAEQVVQALKPAKDSDDEKRFDAIAKFAGEKPKDEAAWRKALDGKGDPAAGERLFFHPRGPRCFACHRIDGRGSAIGPDLSTIGRSLSRDKLIESILTPSKEIAPQFVSWIIVTKDGKSRTGMIVEEKFDSTIVIADTEGKLETINRLDIEDRQAANTSIMPDNLPALMTRQEFRDLLAYLNERK
jgi:putative heme-binding domain-containing protein